jgi:WD40 repeat protein
MLVAADPNPAPVPEIPAVGHPTYQPGFVFDLSPDGKTLVTGFSMERHSRFLRLWDLKSGAITNDLSLGSYERVDTAKFSPDGKTLAVSLGDRQGTFVRLINARSGANIREFWGFEGIARVQGFSADGKKLLTIDDNVAGRKPFKPQLVTWDVQTAKQLTAIDASPDKTMQTSTPDGSVQARFNERREIIVTRDGEKPLTIGTKGVSYWNLFLTPDGKRLVAGTHAWGDVFDTTTGDKVREVRVDSQTITSVASADSGRLLFVASRSFRDPNRQEGPEAWVYVWDITKPELKAVIMGLGGEVWKVQPTADGKRFVVLSGNEWGVSKIEVWDTAKKKELHVFELPANARYGQAVVSPDGNWVAHLSQDKDKPRLLVWNTDTGKLADEVTKAAGGTGGTLTFTPDSERLITVSSTGYAEWDLATGKKAVEWTRDKQPDVFLERLRGASAVPLPNLKGVFTVAPTNKRRQSYVLRLLTEKKDWLLAEFWDHASTPVVSSDGRWVAIVAGNASEGVKAFLLRVDADGKPELKKKADRTVGPIFDGDQVMAWRTWEIDRFSGIIAFSPDGKRLFTGGANHALQVWDTANQELKATLYVAPPSCSGEIPTDWVAFTPAGHFAAGAGGERVLRFRETAVLPWFDVPLSTGTVSASEFAKMRNPDKVREALGGK